MVIGTLSIPEGRAAGEYSVTLLKGNGHNDLTPEKIKELWKQAERHPVLFSDHTEGQLEPFLDLLYRPDSVFFEIYRDDEQRPVGLLFVDQIIPMFDLRGHFAFWDSVGAGREPLIRIAMNWLFETYKVKRISAEIPENQRGTISFTKKLGFTQEGKRRACVVYKGDWVDEVLFGILREEFYDGAR